MFVLKYIRSLYKTLSADASPSAVAFGLAFGFSFGCVPLASGIALLLLALILVFRVQVTSAILAWGLGRLVTVAGGAALFETIGRNLLETDALRGFWTWFLNLPLAAWLGFEYYAVLGGAVFGCVVGAVLFYPLRQLVIAYRRWLHEKVSENKFFRWFTNVWIIRALRFVFIGAKTA